MTNKEIEFFCNLTYPKENFKILIDHLKTLPEDQQKIIWRILVPKKIYSLYESKRFKFTWGGRWGSKTHSIGKILLYKANQKKLRILCTREIQNTLAESVHAELKTIIYNLDYGEYYITENSIVNKKTKSEFIFKGLQQQERRQTIKSLSSIDICWIEEAQTISKASLDILIPTIRKQNSEIWFSYNQILPDDPVDKLRQSVDESEKTEINILAFDNLFNSQETWKDIERLKKQYDDGVNDDYLHVVLGHPASLSDKVVLTLSKLYDSVNREIDESGAIEIGVDIARFGKDRTVFFKRKGMKIIDWATYTKKSVMEVCNLLIDFVDNDKNVLIKIDDTGVGGGVTDYMQFNGFNVWPVIFGAAASDPDKYSNLITEMWFYMKSILNEISLPDMQELISELSTREYKIDMKGRKQIEPKEDYRKRYSKSPDLADACLLCFFQEPYGDAHFFGG